MESRESLALKFRPRSFDDLVGQQPIQVILRRMVEQQRVHPVLLFDGPRGIGKTTTLRILAAALNCEGSPVPCGHCVSCKSVFTGTSCDLIEIDAASNGLVDDIRQLRNQVLYATSGQWQVIGLDEAHGVSTAGFNALLKTIEEPPPNTVFVFLTTEPRKIPDTIYSRCMPFTFRRIAVTDMTARLRHIRDTEQLRCDDDLLTLIAQRADGGMRDAIMALDQTTRAGIHTVTDYTALIGERDAGPILLRPIVAGDHAASFAALTEQMATSGDPTAITNALIGTLRDVLVLRGGGDLPVLGDALATRQALATDITPPLALAAMRVLWDVKTKIRADDRASLDLATAMLIDVFTHAKPQQPPPPARRLTLADMARR